jgi:hypothetical protein
MKNSGIVSLAFGLLLFSGLAFGQITPEATYNHSGTYTQLANSGYKFFLMDVGANQCRIYNTNHSLWKTINLTVPANHYLYDVKFVSENLFTTDNTLCLAYIYYNYNSIGQYYTYTARVIRENGTVLLTIQGCQHLSVHRLTGQGTKLLAYSYDYSSFPNYTVQTHVYGLPGQLVSVPEINGSNGAQLQAAYPNPASEFTVVPYKLPDGIFEGQLIITDAKGNEVRRYLIDRNFDHLRFDTKELPVGVYLYRIVTDNYQSEAFKLIVQ